jgi:hypothetical protein
MPGERTNAGDDQAAHDVLAAEAFAVPTPDPKLRHEHLELPEDPSGIVAPHDILAAEEFAMPAATPPGGGASAGVANARRGLVGAVLAALALIGLRRARR